MYRRQTYIFLNMYKNNSKIRIAFYKASSDEPWINRLTQMLTGDLVHCEIVFSDNNNKSIACSIYQGETVFMKAKTFGRDSWTFKSISLTEKQIQTIKTFCEEQVKKQIPFNKNGLIRCTTPFPRATDGLAWFCSELVVSALQLVDICKDLDPSMTTPSMLFTYLRNKDCTINESAVFDRRIKEKGLRFASVKTTADSAKIPKHKKKRLKFKRYKFIKPKN